MRLSRLFATLSVSLVVLASTARSQVGGGGGNCSGCVFTHDSSTWEKDSTGTLFVSAIGFDGLCMGGSRCRGYACDMYTQAIFSPSDPNTCGFLETCVVSWPSGQMSCDQGGVYLCSGTESHVKEVSVKCDRAKTVIFTVGALIASVDGQCSACDPN